MHWLLRLSEFEIAVAAPTFSQSFDPGTNNLVDAILSPFLDGLPVESNVPLIDRRSPVQ